MKIKYFGHSCFLVEGEYSVLTDPFSFIGFSMERIKADFCLISHGHFDHNCSKNAIGAKVFDGESSVFNASEIALEKIKTYHDDKRGALRGENTVFKFALDGVTFCHLGDLGESFSFETAKRIGSCDVLFLPVGGNYTINASEAKKYADAIAPKIVVPMHFKTPRSNIDIDSLDGFKLLYKSIIECFDEFVFDKDALKTIDSGTLLTFDTDRF